MHADLKMLTESFVPVSSSYTRCFILLSCFVLLILYVFSFSLAFPLLAYLDAKKSLAIETPIGLTLGRRLNSGTTISRCKCVSGMKKRKEKRKRKKRSRY